VNGQRDRVTGKHRVGVDFVVDVLQPSDELGQQLKQFSGRLRQHADVSSDTDRPTAAATSASAAASKF